MDRLAINCDKRLFALYHDLSESKQIHVERDDCNNAALRSTEDCRLGVQKQLGKLQILLDIPEAVPGFQYVSVQIVHVISRDYPRPIRRWKFLVEELFQLARSHSVLLLVGEGVLEDTFEAVVALQPFQEAVNAVLLEFFLQPDELNKVCRFTEQMLAKDQVIQNQPERKYVALLRVLVVTEENVWWGIHRSAHITGMPHTLLVFFAESTVANLCDKSLRNEHVLWLEVTMHVALLMNVLESAENLPKHTHNFFRAEGTTFHILG